MRTISKGPEPFELTDWKRVNPHKKYKDLHTSDPGIRQAIRKHALEEQFYLCAYCCQRIKDIDACHNEHVEAQSVNPSRTLDFTNIIASCNTPHQCGNAHQSQSQPLTPLMTECETELQFKISGRVKGVSNRATTAIQVLNLGDSEKNNRSLIEKRKQLSNALLWTNSIDPQQGLEDEEILKRLLVELAQPKQGKLEPFSPVVINILRSWLQV
jgi:uncharacterized protein (TIGR02646 family)